MARSPGFRREGTAEGGCNASLRLALTIALALAGTAPAGADAPAPPEPDPPPAPVLPPRPVGEVSVTATRAERAVLETPGNVTVIDRQQIERSGTSHVAELLRREAGIYVTNSTSSPEGYTVEARGFNNGGGNGSGTLVLVDGRRVNEASSSVTDWALMHLDVIERIEITRGPASALYGDNASAGVIQIFTRRATEAPTVTYTGRIGRHDTKGQSLFAATPIGPLRASLFVDDYSSDDFREGADFRSDDVEGSVEGTLADQVSLRLRAGRSSDTRKRPGDLLLTDLETGDRDDAAPDEDDFNDVRQYFVDSHLEWSLGDEALVQVLPHYRRRTDSGVLSFVGGSSRLDTTTDAAGVDAQIRLDRTLAGLGNRLITGFGFLYEDRAFSDLTEFEGFGSTNTDRDGARRVWGGFVQDELNLTPDLLLSAGVRFDTAHYDLSQVSDSFFLPQDFDANVDDDGWSPKLALTWRPCEPVSLYGSFARGFRFPNLDEASGIFGLEPGLRPQHSQTFEVGAKVRSQRVSANLALYHMNVEDEILFDPVAQNPLSPFPGRNINFDRIRHRGIETSIQVRPTDWLEIYGSYTFDDTKIRRDAVSGLEGNRVPITPLHRGNAGLRLDLPYWVELGLDGRFVSSRYIGNDLENDLERLSKFASWDALVRFVPPLPDVPPLPAGAEVALSFAMRNLFAREYVEFASESSFSPGVVGFFPSSERTWEVALTLTLRR
jgi:iron complex outermembrane receptor protein